MTFGTFREIKSFGESYKTYIPGTLSSDLIEVKKFYPLLDQATYSLGKIDALSDFLPDINLFIYLYVRKEALLSSQIEGTQSSLADIFMYESSIKPSVTVDDVEEVTNYVAAINYGLERLRKDQFPFSLRLIKEIHKILMQGVRGQEKLPGEFRSSQNWIGGSRPGNAVYVPPPPEMVLELMGALEMFIHNSEQSLPALIKIGMVHLQFESIHPFLDGNGRLGRLLITLLLCAWGFLNHPILYISYYLKLNRQKYYDILQAVRTTGKWDEWIQFFLQGIIDSAEEECNATKRLLAVIEKDIHQIERLGKSAGSIKQVFEFMKRHPIIGISDISASLEMSPHTVTKALGRMTDLGIVQEITGKKRGKLFTYHKYLDVLSEGGEPL